MHSRLLIFMLLFCVPCALAACSQDSTTTSEAPEPYKEGRLHVADRALPVVPFIGHMTSMDQARACQMAADVRQKAGEADATPCFQQDANLPLRTVRIEHREGTRGDAFVQRLAALQEGAHFIIEPTGSVYQTMNLSHAVRRDAMYRVGEVRVLSGGLRGHVRLMEALKTHWPDLTMEEVPLREQDPKPAEPTPRIP